LGRIFKRLIKLALMSLLPLFAQVTVEHISEFLSIQPMMPIKSRKLPHFHWVDAIMNVRKMFCVLHIRIAQVKIVFFTQVAQQEHTMTLKQTSALTPLQEILRPPQNVQQIAQQYKVNHSLQKINNIGLAKAFI
jgi:hypothetical protein